MKCWSCKEEGMEPKVDGRGHPYHQCPSCGATTASFGKQEEKKEEE